MVSTSLSVCLAVAVTGESGEPTLVPVSQMWLEGHRWDV